MTKEKSEKKISDDLSCLLKYTKPIGSTRKLHKVFSSVMELFDEKHDIELRIGEIDSIGLAYHTGERRIVFLNKDDSEYFDKELLSYLIGHEIGHIMMIDSIKAVPEDKKTDQSQDSKNDMPLILAYNLNQYNSEVMADIFGIAACGSVKAPARMMDYGYGGRCFSQRFDKDDYGKPSKEYDSHYFTELRLKGIKLFSKSALMPKVLANPKLVLLDEKQMEDEELTAKEAELLAPILNYSNEDNAALAEYTGAAMYVMFGGKFGYDKSVRIPKLIEDFRWFNPDGKTLEHASEDDALKRMDELKSKVRGIDHPLKHEAFSLIAESTFGTEGDDIDGEIFLHDIGSDIGIDYEEIRENVMNGRGHCW